ncbi:MAG TPA: hypothetical protein VNR38_26425 [Ureibacillus sp.]|nr:hypothetical protein [Ureibacillus sp.]
MKKLNTFLLILAILVPTIININVTVNTRTEVNNRRGDSKN